MSKAKESQAPGKSQPTLVSESINNDQDKNHELMNLSTTQEKITSMDTITDDSESAVDKVESRDKTNINYIFNEIQAVSVESQDVQNESNNNTLNKPSMMKENVENIKQSDENLATNKSDIMVKKSESNCKNEKNYRNTRQVELPQSLYLDPFWQDRSLHNDAEKLYVETLRKTTESSKQTTEDQSRPNDSANKIQNTGDNSNVKMETLQSIKIRPICTKPNINKCV